MNLGALTLKKLCTIRLVISDVDGTLARRLLIDSAGKNIKVFCEKDGYMIVEAVRAGVSFAMLSGIDSPAARSRAADLKIPFFTRHEMSGDASLKDPLEFFEKKYGVNRTEIMYIGDGWLDLWWMSNVGVSVAPADADPECRAIADIITEAEGGEGVAAEVLSAVLKEKEVYNDILRGFFMNPFSKK